MGKRGTIARLQAFTALTRPAIREGRKVRADAKGAGPHSGRRRGGLETKLTMLGPEGGIVRQPFS